MAKLYLIRRSLEQFVGPMGFTELKDSLQRMDFGLQDEISGHCGPWAQLDNITALKKQYPEVARMIADEGRMAWHVSEEGKRISGDDETRRIRVSRKRGLSLALAFLMIAVIAFAAALYMASGGRLSGKPRPVADEPDLAQVEAPLQRRDMQQFDAYMEANLNEIVARVTKQKRYELDWMPYVRLFAFRHEGSVAGLSPKFLRGNGAAFAPADCSMRSWRQRWRTSIKSWNQLLQERKVVRAHWARILAWDPHWIVKRDAKGWYDGSNYYEACLVIADKALEELTTDTSLVQVASDWEKFGLNKIRQRLIWLKDNLRPVTAGEAPQPSTSAPTIDQPLAVWSCIEGARDLTALQKCRGGIGVIDETNEWQTYTEKRYNWAIVRIAAASPGTISPELQTQLAKIADKLDKWDFFTRFDYKYEQKLGRSLVKLSVPVEKAVEKIGQEFPELRPAH